MCQWADTNLFGAAPGNPALLNGATTDGVGIQVAFRDDGGNPWNGTSNFNGADTKIQFLFGRVVLVR